MTILSFYIYLTCATILFLLPQQRQPYFWIRLLFISILGYLCVYYARHNIPFGYLNNLISFTLALGLMTLTSRLCYCITWGEAAFCAVGGYSVQFMQSTFAEMLHRTVPGWNPYSELIRFFCAAIMLTLCYILFCRRLKKGRNLDVSKSSLLLLLVAATLIEIIICYNLRQQWRASGNALFIVSDCSLLLICSFCLLTIQFNLLTKQDLEAELQVLTQMWHKEQTQFQISRDTIDLINRKCHDMRYQIRTIGENTHIDPQVVREMEDAVQIYDALAKTGSQALDIILAEKNLFCQKNGIHISCIADGAKLSFLRESDIYSLFGNLLDNAIQAVMLLPLEQRIINLSVRSVGELLSINSYNRFTGTVEMADGLPVTASADLENHGFGTRSMSKIVGKYGGTISFLAKDGIFNVNILFPSANPEQ